MTRWFILTVLCLLPLPAFGQAIGAQLLDAADQFNAVLEIPTPTIENGNPLLAEMAIAGLRPAPSIIDDERWQENYLLMISDSSGGQLYSVGSTEVDQTLRNSLKGACAIIAKGPSGNQLIGSGALIGPNVVVTAAHVANDARIKDSCHVCFAGNIEAAQPAEVIEVVEPKFPHEEFDVDDIEVQCPVAGGTAKLIYPQATSDIAVLILKQEVAITAFELATEEEVKNAKKLRAVGYGLTINPALGIFGAIGKQMTVEMAVGDASLHGCDAAKEIVAGDNQKGTCAGDSGAPLLIEILSEDGPPKYKVAAVVSRATRCGGKCGSSINTRTDAYANWVKSVRDRAAMTAGASAGGE